MGNIIFVNKNISHVNLSFQQWLPWIISILIGKSNTCLEAEGSMGNVSKQNPLTFDFFFNAIHDYLLRNTTNISMSLCSPILYKYMKSRRTDVHNLTSNTHVRSRTYPEFYNCIVFTCLMNEGQLLWIRLIFFC